MVERHFEEELKRLFTDLVKMGVLADQAIFRATEALKNRDKALARQVIEDDKKIDEMELVVDERAIDLLALHQPVAIDLRSVTTAIRINAELERIADLAVNICQCVIEIADKPLIKPLIDIPRMSEEARKMVKDAVDSFVSCDEDLARKVILSDPRINKLRDSVYNELVGDFMVKDGTTAPLAVPLLLISRHLERICDHATNIAEDVIYMVRAKVVKHRRINNRDH